MAYGILGVGERICDLPPLGSKLELLTTAGLKVAARLRLNGQFDAVVRLLTLQSAIIANRPSAIMLPIRDVVAGVAIYRSRTNFCQTHGTCRSDGIPRCGIYLVKAHLTDTLSNPYAIYIFQKCTLCRNIYQQLYFHLLKNKKNVVFNNHLPLSHTNYM